MEIEKELSLNDYLSILKRRLKNVITVFFLVTLIVIFVAYILPSVYESKGVISVESPVISEEIVKQSRPDKYIDERIDKVKQKVLSKNNIKILNDKYKLFTGISDSKKLVQAFNKQVFVVPETRKNNLDPWTETKVTVGLVVGFHYSDPEITYKVANELITLFLNENSKDRTRRVTQTTSFLNEELDRMKSELETVENKVAIYKKLNANSLPEHQELHMKSMDRVSSEIKSLDREYKDTREELRYLDVELSTTESKLNQPAGTKVLKVSALDKARAELERGLVLYKETHPTIRALKRKITNLEQAVQEPVVQKQPSKDNIVIEIAIAKIKSQSESAKARLASIVTQKKSLQREISSLQSRIIKIPEVERGLFTLLRDYENAKEKYEDVKAKQLNAKIAENLEINNKSERFVLKESPVFPKYRISPVRKKIIGLGTLGALVLGLLFGFFLEMLDKRVRGKDVLSSIINMEPLAVIPYINTKKELSKSKRQIRAIIFIGVISTILIMAAVSFHYFIMPLNEILLNI